MLGWGDVRHRQLSPSADHPPHGEGAPHLRDERCGQSRVIARSRLLQERLPKGYAATRARRAVYLEVVLHSDDDLWSFVMLPDARLLSTASFCPLSLPSYSSFALMVPTYRW
jgi:hypothetical protein